MVGGGLGDRPESELRTDFSLLGMQRWEQRCPVGSVAGTPLIYFRGNIFEHIF